MALVKEIWKRKHYNKYKMDFDKAAERGLKIAAEHPDWLQHKPRRKNDPYKCSDCVNLKDFPITPMEIIYKIMGYNK